ncbi:MAG TPA: hypothetical protein VD932_03615 [Aquabacterium sp.]|nr:hypothetical protein [Aquabacterium sp.]
MSEPKLEYDPASRKATIEFPNGHKLRVGNVDETQARNFFERHAKEFERRNCVLETTGCFEVRTNG